MRHARHSGEPKNGEVLITGIRGPARFVRSKLDASLRDNGDGTASIVLPAGMKHGDGHFVVWEDDDGEHHTACVIPEPPGPTIEERITALENAAAGRYAAIT